MNAKEPMRELRITSPMASERHQARTAAMRALDRAVKRLKPETLRALYALALVNDRSELTFRIEPVCRFFGADARIVGEAFGFRCKRHRTGRLVFWLDRDDRLSRPPFLPLNELQAAKVFAWAFSSWVAYG